MPLYLNVWRFLWTEKLFLIAASLTHTFFTCEFQPWTTQICARSDFGHKSVVCKVMIDGSSFLMSLQVSRWNDCKIETFCLISGMCVLHWENPQQQNPSPSVPPTMPAKQTKMHNILTHKHTNTNRSWIHTAPKLTVMCILFHAVLVLDVDWSKQWSMHANMHDMMMHNTSTVAIVTIQSYYFILKWTFGV